jgi:hypothetical protein
VRYARDVTPRRRLADLALTGWRAVVRKLLFAAVPLAAAVALIGYLLPAHRLRGEHAFHSNFADGGPFPVLVLVFAGAIAVLLRRRGHGAGYMVGVIGAGGAIGAFGSVLLAHFLSRVEYALGEPVFVLAAIGLFFAGVALLLAEPIVYLTERRRLERDVDPQFPSARVV